MYLLFELEFEKPNLRMHSFTDFLYADQVLLKYSEMGTFDEHTNFLVMLHDYHQFTMLHYKLIHLKACRTYKPAKIPRS